MGGQINLNDNSKTAIVITALICLTLLEAMALYLGINGVGLSAVIGAITAIVGLVFGIKVGQKQSAAEPK